MLFVADDPILLPVIHPWFQRSTNQFLISQRRRSPCQRRQLLTWLLKERNCGVKGSFFFVFLHSPQTDKSDARNVHLLASICSSGVDSTLLWLITTQMLSGNHGEKSTTKTKAIYIYCWRMFFWLGYSKLFEIHSRKIPLQTTVLTSKDWTTASHYQAHVEAHNLKCNCKDILTPTNVIDALLKMKGRKSADEDGISA